MKAALILLMMISGTASVYAEELSQYNCSMPGKSESLISMGMSLSAVEETLNKTVVSDSVFNAKKDYLNTFDISANGVLKAGELSFSLITFDKETIACEKYGFSIDI